MKGISVSDVMCDELTIGSSFLEVLKHEGRQTNKKLALPHFSLSAIEQQFEITLLDSYRERSLSASVAPEAILNSRGRLPRRAL